MDYRQLEIVILAHLITVRFGPSDPLVVAIEADKDIHGPLAHYIFGVLGGDAEVAAADPQNFKATPYLKMLRDLAKAGIYGNNYGKGEQGFATSVFLPDGTPLGLNRAKLLKQGLNEVYPGIARYQDFIRTWIERKAFIVSLFGRWYPLPAAKSTALGHRNRAWRQALNQPMQAGGQEIMALALIAIMNSSPLRSMGFELSLVVHDEIVGWAPEATAEQALAEVKRLMMNSVTLNCPLQAEGHTGQTWQQAKG